MKKRSPLHPFRITASVVAALVLLWVAGFVAFYGYVVFKEPANPDQRTDVVVVLTGGPGRIEEGFSLMLANKASAMLVTGVHPHVSRNILAQRWQGSAQDRARLENHCCIFIEHNAETTEDNAAETAGWLNRNGGSKGVSIRLVTSDYHMPRAKLLFSRAMPGATLEAWPVRSTNTRTWAFMRTVLIEYSKTFLMWIS